MRSYLFLLIASLSISLYSRADASQGTIMEQDRSIAQTDQNSTQEMVLLVNDAATLIRTKGEAAFDDFRVHGGRWQQGETYIFVLDPAGNMLVHPDAEMEGKNQLDLKDVNGRPIVKGLLAAATTLTDAPEGWYHYQWPVPGGLLPRWKSSFVKMVQAPSGKKYVVGAGDYNDHMNREFVVDAVDKAVNQIEEKGKAAFEFFYDPTGPFLVKDAYIFVIGPNGKELVNPAFRYLEGRNLMDQKDARGKMMVPEMFEVIREKGSGWVDYMWPKPGESVSTLKSTYVRGAQLGDRQVLVGCGVYLEDAPKMAYDVKKMTAPELMELVREAASVLEQRGETALPEFRDEGSKWFREDRYFFIWTTDGVRYFHAANPAGEGAKMNDFRDVLSRPLGKMVLEIGNSPDGEGWVHYMYPEPGDIFPTWKSSFIKRVTFPSGKDYIIGCGIYNMQMNKAFIKDVVNRAADLVADKGPAAFDQLRDKKGPFMFMDVFVFVDNVEGVELVNGAQPSLEGQLLIDKRDLKGKLAAKEYIEAAVEKGSAWVNYYWYPPGKNTVAKKHTFVRAVKYGDETYIVGAGLYEKVEQTAQSSVLKTSWEDLEQEWLTDELSRQILFGENATLSRLTAKKGSGIVRHQHESEEYSWVVSGALRFIFDDREVVVRTGEIIIIPSNVPHAIDVLEDSEFVDFFSPIREDWLKGEDQYLRKLNSKTTGSLNEPFNQSSTMKGKEVYPMVREPERTAVGNKGMAARTFEYPETREIVQLVEAAADLIRQKGESAFSELAQKDSRWQQGEAYIFVLDPKGNMLVHPDPELKGKNQWNLKDINGKPIIRGLIETATTLTDQPSGWYHYQWPVPGGLLPRWKSSYVRTIEAPSGETYIVGSGVYNDRMERAFVVDAVMHAVNEIEQRGEAAFPVFYDPKGAYLAKDAYIWVADLNGVELVNPAFRHLEGQKLLDKTDADGKYVYREMIRMIQTQGAGWVDYMWPKPGESVPSRKSAYVHAARLGDQTVMVGCGVYLAEAPRATFSPPKMTAAELTTLVRDAAKLLEEEGEKAFSTFRQKGSRWLHDDTYLFGLNLDGIRVFYGIAPEEEGLDDSDLKGALGRPMFKMIRDAVSSPAEEGWVHYMFAQPGEIHPAWKSSFVKRLTTPSGKDYIIGCGIYNMQMNKAFIEDLVNRAGDLVQEQGKAAFDLLRDKKGPFVFMNTYVFVLSPDGTELVNGGMPYLEGKNLLDLKDLRGKTVIRDEIDAAMTEGSAWLEHYWYLPGSNKPALKQTFVKKVQHDGETFIVGSGLYEEDQASGTKQLGILKTSWKELDQEWLTDELSRQVIFGEKATLSRLTAEAGSGVERHSHESEEFSWILSGALRFIFDDRELVARAGDIIIIPSNVPHTIEVLEDAEFVDFFAPIREDWLKGEDQYLRKLN